MGTGCDAFSLRTFHKVSPTTTPVHELALLFAEAYPCPGCARTQMFMFSDQLKGHAYSLTTGESAPGWSLLSE